MRRYTTTIQEIDASNTNTVGGKGASLGELQSAGVTVPEGFIVTTTAFTEFIDVADLRPEIESQMAKVDPDVPHTMDQASETIHYAIENATIPQTIVDEVWEAYSELNAEYVAVRSSAVAEDGASAAWAGQLDTFLNTTRDQLIEHIQKCWASFFSPRALFYRPETGQHDALDMAVVIQKMVQSEKAGIAFSVHPVTQNPNQLIIESSYGLGEAVVSGQVTPDSFVMEKDSGEIVETYIAQKERQLSYSPASKINEWITVSKELQDAESLSASELLELATQVVRIEEHYGKPMDIEWAIAGNTLYITQARPITTLNNPSNESNSNEREVVVSHRSDVLTQDVILKGVYLHSAFSDYGTSFRFPLIKYDHATGDISYPTHQLQELDDLILTQDEFARLITFLENEIGSYHTYIKTLEKRIYQLSSLDDEVLEFFEKTLKQAGIIPYFAFERGLQTLFTREEIPLDSVPSSKTYTSMVDDELRAIASKYNEPMPHLDESEDLRKDLEQFCSQFGYLGMSYFSGSPWSLENAYTMLQDVTSAPSSQNSSAKTHSSPYIEIAGDLLRLRTKNWELMCKGALLFRKIVEKYFPHIDYPDLLQLRVDDVIEVLQDKGKADERAVKKQFTIEITKEGVVVSTGSTKEKKQSYNLSADVLTGTCAQKGKAEGEAKIILEPKECSKIVVGDILVAKMSTPDYLPGMRKAAAFVTDIGGITSHAAIVAREMQKPCIIGTQYATSWLQDGTNIEVDADNETIRKL